MAECNSVLVVYAYEEDKGAEPWIYGIYQDHSEGMNILEKMENSKEYERLIWDNKIMYIE